MKFLTENRNLIATALILWRLAAAGQITAQADAHPAARIVTRYTVTSTAQSDGHDPTAWRLLASNDGGQTWALLDARTNEQFTARSQPVTCFLSNRQAFSTYRLQIDAVRSTDITLDMSVQLAGLSLAGPFVGSPDASKLQLVVNSSCADPIKGPVEFALDDDPATAWCDYGLGSPGGCWLQVAYTLGSTILVTNLNQAITLARQPAALFKLADGGARVLSNLTVKAAAPRILTAYALTSANDESGRDPRNWELRGSNDGQSWTLVDSRVNENFDERFERRVFNLTNPARFRLFRLDIQACAAPNKGCQLARLEPLYTDPAADAKYSLVISASIENPPLEAAEMAFDDDFRTKWLSFADASPQNPCWLQWQLTPRETNLPVINQRQLDLLARRLRLDKLLADTNLVPITITGYALTSANDAPDRDPGDWKLLGSNDGGKTWDLLDDRQHEKFSERFQRRVFPLARPAAYQKFRLEIESVNAPADAGCAQLAELEALFEDPKNASSLTVVASSQGENSPPETVDRLFDRDVKTKWLDFAAASSNRASWIEWHYAKGAGEGVLNWNREQVTQPLRPPPLALRLSAVALFVDGARGVAGLGDPTGFQWVHLQPWPAGIAPGMQIELSGELQINGGSLWASAARAESLSPLPAISKAAPPPVQPFVTGSLAGRFSGIFSGPAYCGATLTLSNGTSLLVRLPGQRFPLPPEVLCPVRIDGVVQYLMTPGRVWEPGILWVARPEQITFAPQSEADWNELPEYSPSLQLPSAVRLRGVVEGRVQAGPAALRVGTNRVMADFNGLFPASSGTSVEVAGWLVAGEGQLKLRHACLDTAPPAAEATPLLTRISEVRRLLKRNPQARARVKTQGMITYIDPNLGEFYLQDGDDGMLVRGQMNAGVCPKLSEEGNYVELQGVVQDDDLDATSFVRVLGRGQLPAPPHPSWDHMLSGDDDGRWVAVEGVITEAQDERITLSVAGGELIARINELDGNMARSLPGSMARVRGVCAPILNSHRQRIGMRLLVPSLECVDLLGLVPENLFNFPLLPMKSVMSADCGVVGAHQRYVKIGGVVTCRQGRLLFLQNQADGMRVVLRDDATVMPGDVVEAVGMPQPDGLSAKLIQAVVRKTGHAAVPDATPIDLTRVNTADLAQQQDATRVEIEATLVNESTDASRWILNLSSDKARQVFAAYLPADARLESQTFLPVGSRLKVKGVFKAIQDKTLDVGQAATSFEVYLDSPDDITVLERPSWWTARHALELMAAFGGIVAVGFAWIWLLRNQVRQRTRDLAAEVAERTRLQADADKTHKELLVVARQAGMAEVATGILHNVGNVLNSVNVSSTLVIQHLRQSRIDGLAKTVTLLRQHENDLGHFLMTDAKGQNLVPYLDQLSAHLATNQAGALEELQDLRKNIEHIKEIVAVQQGAAKFAGMIERLPMVELVEDALRLNASSLGRHEVKVVREFDPKAPLVHADRHKVLQILVNLINNAQQACDASGRADKQIILGIQNGHATVRVSVRDNGIGIPPENMERVFNHGFTTRKDGHGFGLHNAALAAKEMGGSLKVTSEGPGCGATFTLELPCGAPPAAT